MAGEREMRGECEPERDWSEGERRVEGEIQERERLGEIRWRD